MMTRLELKEKEKEFDLLLKILEENEEDILGYNEEKLSLWRDFFGEYDLMAVLKYAQEYESMYSKTAEHKKQLGLLKRYTSRRYGNVLVGFDDKITVGGKLVSRETKEEALALMRAFKLPLTNSLFRAAIRYINKVRVNLGVE